MDPYTYGPSRFVHVHYKNTRTALPFATLGHPFKITATYSGKDRIEIGRRVDFINSAKFIREQDVAISRLTCDLLFDYDDRTTRMQLALFIFHAFRYFSIHGLVYLAIGEDGLISEIITHEHANEPLGSLRLGTDGYFRPESKEYPRARAVLIGTFDSREVPEILQNTDASAQRIKDITSMVSLCNLTTATDQYNTIEASYTIKTIDKVNGQSLAKTAVDALEADRKAYTHAAATDDLCNDRSTQIWVVPTHEFVRGDRAWVFGLTEPRSLVRSYASSVHTHSLNTFMGVVDISLEPSPMNFDMCPIDVVQVQIDPYEANWVKWPQKLAYAPGCSILIIRIIIDEDFTDPADNADMSHFVYQLQRLTTCLRNRQPHVSFIFVTPHPFVAHCAISTLNAVTVHDEAQAVQLLQLVLSNVHITESTENDSDSDTDQPPSEEDAQLSTEEDAQLPAETNASDVLQHAFHALSLQNPNATANPNDGQ